MSGWNPDTLEYELTPTKARYYWRRDWPKPPDGIHPVTHRLRSAGLRVCERIYTGAKSKTGGIITRRMGPDKSYPDLICSWLVQGTIAQIWVVLSGSPSGSEAFRNEGKAELKEAGLYVPVQLDGQWY